MQIKIGNSIIPLSQGIGLPIVMKSPLFLDTDNRIPGSYIFNSSFPATDQLRKEFGQAHRFQRHGKATAELPYVITSNSLKYQGNCLVTEADKDSYEISFKIDNGDFAGRLDGKTLKDLDLGGDRIISATYSAAHNFNPIYRSQSRSVYFFDTYALNFYSVDLDLTNSFNEPGTVFTCPNTEHLNVTVEYKITPIYGVHFYLDFYVGASAQNSVQITANDNVKTAEITVNEGDQFHVELRAEAQLINSNYCVEYDLIELYIDLQSKNNAMNENNEYAVFPIQNTQFLSNFPDDAFQLDNLSLKTIYTEYIKTINYYTNRFPVCIRGKVEDEIIFAANLFTPFVYLSVLLQKIASEAGYTIVNNPFDNEFKGLVIFNAYAENLYSSTNTSLIPVKTSFNLIDHVPEITQGNFIRWLSVLTGYMPLVDNNELSITFVDIKSKHIISESNQAQKFPGKLLVGHKIKIVPEYKGIKIEIKKASTDNYLSKVRELNEKLNYKGEVPNTSYLPTGPLSNTKANDLYLVNDINEYWLYQYNPEIYLLDWCFFSINFPLSYSEGKEPYLTITSEFCPVLTKYQADETPGSPANRKWIIPVTEQPGILEGFPDSLGAEYGLQVLYYKGMVNDSLGKAYPLGSCRMDDYPNNPDSSPDISSNGIFNSRYKSFLKWMAFETKPGTIKALLTTSQLKQLKFDQIYTGDGYNFLIKELSVNLEHEGLSIAELTIYTC